MKKIRISIKKNTHRIELDGPACLQLLKDLCNKHPSFNNFYLENKAAIDDLKIKWVIDQNCKEEGISSPILDTITLRKYPVSIDDARIVTHEIEHHLIWKRGFPYVMADLNPNKSRKVRERLARALAGMIYEPMVEAKLKHFFENLCDDHQKNALTELRKRVAEKKVIHEQILDPIALLYYSCLYVKYLRLMRATCDNEETAEFIRGYKEHFGENIVVCAEKIITLIEANGINSPASVKMILETIIKNRKFGLTYKFQEHFKRFIIDFALRPCKN